MIQTYQYGVSPYQTSAVAPTQTGGLDISSLLSTILPLMTLMLVFSMITPMFKSMGGAFGGGK
ncbi:MAG: hypothetical protein Q7R34_12365 [Dehalococcoidia bacterium]|nr:hypothetical protein [Dehalococcoidia bacterium]